MHIRKIKVVLLLPIMLGLALNGCSTLEGLAVSIEDNAVGCLKADVGTRWNPFAMSGVYVRMEVPDGMELTVEQFIQLAEAICPGLSKDQLIGLLGT